MNVSKPWEMVKERETWHAAVRGVTKRWTRLSEQTTVSLRCITCQFDILMYCKMIPTIVLALIPPLAHNYHFFFCSENI